MEVGQLGLCGQLRRPLDSLGQQLLGGADFLGGEELVVIEGVADGLFVDLHVRQQFDHSGEAGVLQLDVHVPDARLQFSEPLAQLCGVRCGHGNPFRGNGTHVLGKVVLGAVGLGRWDE